MKFILRALTIIVAAFILFSCKEKIEPDAITVSSPSPKPIDKEALILELSKKVLTSIKTKDYKKLTEFIHPTSGVRFSPYAYIDTITHLKFSKAQLLQEIKTKNKLDWGNYDGSGDTILLTIEDYFSKFVYNADFLNAEKTSWNKMIGGGNSLNNLETVYKDCDYVESYFSGFDKKYEGMDWCCLRLVFKKHLDKFYLITIVHDQWTS
jgi:hypothetical protein